MTAPDTPAARERRRDLVLLTGLFVVLVIPGLVFAGIGRSWTSDATAAAQRVQLAPTVMSCSGQELATPAAAPSASGFEVEPVVLTSVFGTEAKRTVRDRRPDTVDGNSFEQRTFDIILERRGERWCVERINVSVEEINLSNEDALG